MTIVQIIDLCGRWPVWEGHLERGCGPDWAGPIRDEDLDFIFDQWAEGKPAFIGEVEYREITATNAPSRAQR